MCHQSKTYEDDKPNDWNSSEEVEDPWPWVWVQNQSRQKITGNGSNLQKMCFLKTIISRWFEMVEKDAVCFDGIARLL